MLIRSAAILLTIFLSQTAGAAEIQGVLTDWNCTRRMVKEGREKILKDDRSCSLTPNSARGSYGLITDDKKFYQLDDNGVKQAKELLNNSHDKDNLRVITRGHLEGNTMKVDTMSIL